MKMTFRVHAGENGPEFPTFEEAFVVFFTAVRELVRKGTALQILETFCWIEGAFEFRGDTHRAPLYFRNARDFAYDMGILVKNEGDEKPSIADPLPKVSSGDIVMAFIESGNNELAALHEIQAGAAQFLDDQPEETSAPTT